MNVRLLCLWLFVSYLHILIPCASPAEVLGERIPEDSAQLIAPMPGEGEVSVEAVIDSLRVPVNRTLTLTVRARCAGDMSRYDFQWPPPPDFERLELVGSASANVVTDEGGRIVTLKEFRYILKPVGEGQGWVGPVTLVYTDKSSMQEHSLTTYAIRVEITEPVADAPRRWPVILWPLIVGFLAATAAGGFIYLRNRRRKKEETAPEGEVRLPEEMALEELEGVPDLRLAGETKEYYSALSHTLRRYIDRRFSLRTSELTTHDIVDSLRVREEDTETLDEIERILTLCDMVKFARHEPAPSDLDRIWTMAQEFFKKRAGSAPAGAKEDERGNTGP